ncbi:hypothetical protein RND71_039537 [Anisodus tanguticus]|uniref:SS18 N-terminal domain-containing protein n=1 Tax=Anisodus tanguticus TaxID=243964 RepID=A0AAE1UVF5_9SOLA|nr:hypothetical protein RND71_039537 [Anisodus tanguticus]
MQQQQQNPVLNSSPLNAITTDQIQKFLDENKNLILAILENQNLGKLSECAQYQALLQKNLMYLAAIADAQPPQSAATSQMAPSITQPGNLMQQTQAAMLQQQQGPIGQKLPFQLNALPSQEQQQQQQMLHFQQQQYGLGPAGNNPMHQLMRPGLTSPGTVDVRGSRHSTSEDGLTKLAPGHVNGDKS